MFSDEDVLGEGFLDKCVDIVETMAEFVATLNDICMPDDDHDSSDDPEEEGDIQEDEDEE